MSFDLYFLVREPGQTWDDAMEALEEQSSHDAGPFEDEDRNLWRQIVAAVTDLIPNAEQSEGESFAQLSDDATGIQLSMDGIEITLSVPYWNEGDEAERAVSLLRDICVAVESLTGRVAYDPQAEAAFLGEGEQSAAETLDHTRRSMVGLHSESDLVTDLPVATEQSPGWWSRFLGLLRGGPSRD